MADETTATTPQAGADGTNLTPQVGDTTPTEPQAGESHNKRNSDDYERMIADLRKENASHRTRLKKFEEEANKAAEAQLSKEQLLEKQYSDLKSQHDEFVQAQTEHRIRSEVALEAAKLGVDPSYLDKVSRFLDWEEINVDDNGNPTNVQELVAQLVKDMPGLKGKGAPAPTSGGATNPSRSASTAPQALSWSVIGKMTPDEYHVRRNEVQQWLAANPPRFR